MIPAHCKRLIEVDLSIGKISENARHEQNVRKGHLHNMHVWWATRPLAACRAVVLASLLPDPADKACPEEFKQKAAEALDLLRSGKLLDPSILRKTLLNFISNFTAWESSLDTGLLKTARRLIEIAYPEGRPIVLDVFAGIGSIPFEALRIGTDVFAADLNPVAVLLLKTALEYIPSYGERLTDAVRKWGYWVREKAANELHEFYPTEQKGGIPIAYIWARTVRCEGPSCGAELPLLGLLWLSQRGKRLVALRYKGDKIKRRVEVDLFYPKSEEEVQSGIVQRFVATCPVCGYTTPYRRVREQLKAKSGGTHDARLIAVITLKPDGSRDFRLPMHNDIEATRKAAQALELLKKDQHQAFALVPDEPLPPDGTLGFRVQKYGMTTWGDLFTFRQILAMNTFVKWVRQTYKEVLKEHGDSSFAKAVTTCVGLALSNISHYLSSISIWASDGMISAFIQGSSLPMRPDFAEANPLVPNLVGGFQYSLEQIVHILEREDAQKLQLGTVRQGPASRIPLPDHSVPAIITDPPYYDAVPYANLSDFCYVWLKRMLFDLYPDLFQWPLTPKAEECIMDPGPPQQGGPRKDRLFFESCIQGALADCKRVLRTDGVAVVLFAHKGTAGWEALLRALVEAGWTVTASWPIETERGARMRARNSAVLASSVFLVCRPRLGTEGVGDWREVLSELQPRVHTWMQRLVKEGIVGADAIFACIGPALEIYSKYNSVETAGGKKIELADKYGQKGELIERGYLSYVWESVAKEALNMIFEGADPSGFEQDSRLTAMWLWTLSTRTNGMNEKSTEEAVEGGKVARKATGYLLEYDAVRKIAQGLGAHLEELGRPGGVVEIKGKIATLLFVTERREALFGRVESEIDKKSGGQITLLGKPVSESTSGVPEIGRTTLDKIHQAMLLFADGKSESLRRFLVEEGVGKDDRFWRLAQALLALYPRSSDEKRWVDGVLVRKKSLGF